MDIDIGPQIKARRSAQSLSLAQLADKSGVSAAMLCDVECGKKNPTLRVVNQIANGLGCSISDLLDLPPVVRFETVRAGERRVLVDSSNGVERHLLSPSLVRRGVQVVLYRLPPRASTEAFPPEPAGVVEHMTVITGRLEVIAGDDRVELGPGDSVTYAADVPHWEVNLTDKPAEFFLVVDSTHPAAGTASGRV